MKCPNCGEEMEEYPAGFASVSNPFPITKSYWKCPGCEIATYDGETWYYRTMKARFTLEELLKEIHNHEQS